MGIRQLFSETKVIVHVLVCIFGISSWVDINGLWVELPILVTHLPEKWTLPSFIVIISQVANIGPIIFFVLVLCCKGVKLEKPASAIIITVGITACVLLSFFWKHTTYLFGELHASALFALSFFLSLVDCTSSMAFLAFMAGIKPQYLSSFFIGEGLSGMLPSLLSLAQGAGSIKCVNGSKVNATLENGTWHNETDYFLYPMYEKPRFSVQVFFLILSGLIAASLISFLLLNFHPYCKTERVGRTSYSLEHNREDATKINQTRNDLNGEKKYGSFTDSKDLDSESKRHFSSIVQKSDPSVEEKKTLPTSTFIFLLADTVFVNMQITTFLLSVQSYTSLPYGLQYYHLAATITNIANPVASFCSLLVPFMAIQAIVLLTLMGTGFSAYLIVLAAMSPNPPLAGTQAGGALSVMSWTCASFLLVYAKVSIAGRLRQHGGRRALLWYGAMTQFGSAIGAITAFVIVNVYSLLKDAPYC